MPAGRSLFAWTGGPHWALPAKRVPGGLSALTRHFLDGAPWPGLKPGEAVSGKRFPGAWFFLSPSWKRRGA